MMIKTLFYHAVTIACSRNITKYFFIVISVLVSLSISPPIRAEGHSDSLQWVPTAFPAGELPLKIYMLNDSLGWIITRQNHFYKWDGKRWQAVPLVPGEKVYTMFTLSENDVWLAVHLKSLYRYCLKHFDGQKWRLVLTPNTVPIRDIFFLNPNAGWAVCEWGEIMHYDGRQWQRVDSPTNYHLCCVRMSSPEHGWIVGENRGKGIILRYRNRKWEVFHRYSYGEGRKVIVKNDSLCWCQLGAEILEIHNDSISEIVLPVIKSENNDRIYFERIFELKAELGLIMPGGQYYHYQNREWKLLSLNDLEFPHNWSIGKGHPDRLMAPVSQPEYLKKQYKRFNRNPIVGATQEYGVAVGDVNRDGYPDIYVVDHEGVNHLIGAGAAAETPFLPGTAAAEKAGIAGKIKVSGNKPNSNIYDSGVSMADIENDGDLDLYLCSMYHPNILYENNGSGHFRQVTEEAGVGGQKMDFSELGVWGDVNNDGYLDLFVANRLTSDVLYLNDGTGRFKNITVESGLASNWGSRSPVFSDIDNDGDPDLFIPHSNGKIRLMRNMGLDKETGLPRFENIAARAGLDTSQVAGYQCAAFGDVDNDGDPDLFLTIYLLPDKLYLNDGSGYFEDISRQAGFFDSTKSKGAVFFDADNDGHLDLFIGHDGPNRFYHNRGDGTFEDLTKEMGFSGSGQITGIACGDFFDYPYNPDGAIDLYVADMEDNSKIFRNSNAGDNYFKFRLIGTISNRDAIGTKVLLYAAGHPGEKAHLRGLRAVQAGGGYCSMSSTIIHFGADPDLEYDARFIFPSGIEVWRQNLAPGQTLVIYEQQGWSRRISETKRWTIRNLKEPDNHREAVLCVFLFALIGAAYKICRKKNWGNRISRIWLIAPPVFFCVLIKILTPSTNLWLFDVLPMFLGILAIAFGLWNSYNLSQQISREDRLNELLLACRAFEHSQWHASYFNQLGLLFNNIGPEHELPEDIKKLVLETISNFYQFIYPEIRRIEQLSRQIFPDTALSDDLKKILLKISQYLDETKIQIAMNKKLPARLLQVIPELITQIRKVFQKISRRVDKHFSTSLIEVLNKLIRSAGQKDVSIEFRNKCHDDKLTVRIRQSELLFILENLFSNAMRALTNSMTKRITIRLERSDFRVFLSFRDSGSGIPESVQARLFEDGSTSKPEGKGGFGLFHSKALLDKYGGEIVLKQSITGQGTEFMVKLRCVN